MSERLNADYALDVDDYWEGSYDGQDWRWQVEQDGYAVLPYDHHPAPGDTATVVSESRWVPVTYSGWVPSRLWDAATPTCRVLVQMPSEVTR